VNRRSVGEGGARIEAIKRDHYWRSGESALSTDKDEVELIKRVWNTRKSAWENAHFLKVLDGRGSHYGAIENSAKVDSPKGDKLPAPLF